MIYSIFMMVVVSLVFGLCMTVFVSLLSPPPAHIEIMTGIVDLIEKSTAEWDTSFVDGLDNE